MPSLDSLFANLIDPPLDFAPIPFWFWNDDLDPDELRRQLHAFRDGGFGGVVIHPRIGLSARIGYLTDEYFRLVRLVVDECAALGLRVILYDEGSYPSGSACGQVVAANPDFAAHAIVCVHKDFSGPWRGYWRPTTGRSLVNRLVDVMLARTSGSAVMPETLALLPVEEPGLVRLEIGEGTWRALACFDVPSGGHIRGVLPEQDDGSALAPASGDILNPAAVATFIRLTHDAYAQALGPHLGTTVVAMFTDEPSPLGRGSRRGIWPYTPGFEAWLATKLGWEIPRVLAWLPALWHDYGPQTAAFRHAYTRAVQERLVDVFYRAQAQWCTQHGIALTGHPAESNDMDSLAPFQWPGQDMVWRYVVPGDESALTGPHSVAPKAATSAARAAGRQRIGTELFGAYGWHLSLDEAKWLLDWHLARGNNLFMPHALFYSVRDGRAFESEPDLALHNAWWPYFQELTRYTTRLSWLLSDCEHVCEVAVLGTGHALPWQAARALYRNQIDFLYVDDIALQRATLVGDGLVIGAQTYRVLVLDPSSADRDGEAQTPISLSPKSQAMLSAFTAAGGTVLHWHPGLAVADFIAHLRRVLSVGRPLDVLLDPPASDMRVIHVRKAGAEVYAFFNEGEALLSSTLSLPVPTPASPAGAPRVLAAEWWDPLRCTRHPAAHTQGGAILHFPITLNRRESRLLVLAVNEGSPPDQEVHITWGLVSRTPLLSTGEPHVIPIPGPWSVTTLDSVPVDAPAPGDWTHVPALERFSGTLCYRAEVTLPHPAASVEIDLGSVGEAAAVLVNGTPIGSSLWAPYRLGSDGHLWRTGPNRIEVQITNSAANHYEGALRPSGLLGPVRAHLWPAAGKTPDLG